MNGAFSQFTRRARHSMLMEKTESAGGIVCNQRGEIALVVNGPTEYWGFPKGHIDEGEDIEAAARREIEEETGLRDVTFVKRLGSYQRFKGKIGGGDDMSELKLIHMFLFTTKEVQLQPQDAGNPEARWFSPDDVATRLTHPKDREFFVSVRHLI